MEHEAIVGADGRNYSSGIVVDGSAMVNRGGRVGEFDRNGDLEQAVAF